MRDLKEIKERIFKSPNVRRTLGKKSVRLFAMIYFPKMFRIAAPPFHRLWYQLMMFKDFKSRVRFTYLILVAFRESAKTTLAKIKIVRDICYKRKKLITYVCYEKEKSGEALFDIATWLQTNPRIIEDFGNLFLRGEGEDKRPEKKTINNFVTSNGVRVTAVSIRQSVRGRIFGFDRPDCYVIDDFENNITKKSAAITRKVEDFFREMMTGLAAGAEVIFLCNKISDTGSVQWLLDMAEKNPDFRVSEVCAIENGKSTWPQKFVLTDEKAHEVNSKILNPEKRVRSLESMKRTMNADGTKTFEQEMLLQPQTEGDRFFDLEKIDTRIETLKAIQYQNENVEKEFYFQKDGDWKRWGNANPDHINIVASDISEGYGLDSSVIQVFDLTESRQIAEYESNRCPPELLGQLMVEEGKKAGYCVLMPERNSVGIATIVAIRGTDYRNLYRQKTIDKITNKPVYKYGWRTHAQTKPLMLFDFKRDFEAGLIEINSIPLLREMRAFTNSDVEYVNFDPEASNHFDRLIAICIAWQGRNVPQIKSVVA